MKVLKFCKQALHWLRVSYLFQRVLLLLRMYGHWRRERIRRTGQYDQPHRYREQMEDFEG